MKDKKFFKKRKEKIRNKFKTFYIFCGGITEKLYFQSIKSEYRSNNLKINLFSKGVAGINFIPIMESYRKKIKDDPLNTIYLVLDRDEGNNTYNQFEEIISYINKNGISLIVNNQSFELWFILHFKLYKREVATIQEYISELSVLLQKEYIKTDNSIYLLIKNNRSEAINNSKKLKEYHLNNGISHDNLIHTEPFSNMYQLIEDIEKSFNY